jgi:hypothetical protein
MGIFSRLFLSLRPVSPEQQTRNERVAEMKWVRRSDLPGYKEWSEQFRGPIRKFVESLGNDNTLVHPDELSASLEDRFERELQGFLEDGRSRTGIRFNVDQYRNR